MGRARQHAIFGGDPAPALAAQPGGQVGLDRGGAQHPRVAEADQAAALGMAGEAGLHGDGAHLVWRAAGRTHRSLLMDRAAAALANGARPCRPPERRNAQMRQAVHDNARRTRRAWSACSGSGQGDRPRAAGRPRSFMIDASDWVFAAPSCSSSASSSAWCAATAGSEAGSGAVQRRWAGAAARRNAMKSLSLVVAVALPPPPARRCRPTASAEIDQSTRPGPASAPARSIG